MKLSIVNVFCSKYVVLMACLCATTMMAETPDEQKKRKWPPQRAIDACQQMYAGDSCSFERRNGNNVNGVCFIPKREGAVKACMPEKRYLKIQQKIQQKLLQKQQQQQNTE